MSETTGGGAPAPGAATPPASAPADPALRTGPRRPAANKTAQGGMSLTDGLRMLRQAAPAHGGAGNAIGATAPQPAAVTPPAPAVPAAVDPAAPPGRKPSARQRRADAAATPPDSRDQRPVDRPATAPAAVPAPAAPPNPTPPASGGHPLDAIMAAFSGGAIATADPPATPPAAAAAAGDPPLIPAPTNTYLAPVSLTIGGKVHAFDHAQLTDLVSKGVDYTAKTQALGETARQIREQQATLAELLPVLLPEVERQLAALNGNGADTAPDWGNLAATDPQEYIRQDAAWKASQATRQAEQARLEAVRAAAKAEEQRQTALKMQTSHLELIRTVPGWKDAPTRQRIQTEMMAWGKKEGFPDEELGSIIEARHIRTMLKAMMFDRMVSGAATRAPVVPAVARGNAPPAPAPAALRDAQNRFAQRGTMNNAVALAVAQRAAKRRTSVMGSA